MKITYFLVALLLLSSFTTQATAHLRTNSSSHRAQLGTRSAAGSRLQEYGIAGREIVAPPWSSACMTDHGPSACGAHVWFYGSDDALARYMDSF